MKVIVGVDDSVHAQASLEFVKGVTWPEGTTFTVVSAAQPLYPMTEVASGTAIALANEELQQHHREVAEHAAGALEAAGLEAKPEVPHGDPRDMLVAFARDQKADLVVVGSHGKGRLERLLLGSVANYVVAHAPCSVLVVKTRNAATRTA